MKARYRVLLDLRGLVWQSYYSGNPRDVVTDEKGELRPSAAHGVDNFITMFLNPILEQHQPIDIIGVLEGSYANTRRRSLYQGYKAKPSQDEDSKIVSEEKDKCLECVQKLLLSVGAMLVKTPYAEADDTIGYLCKTLKGGQLIYTVDGDLLQLYTPSTVAVCIKRDYPEQYKGHPLYPYNPVVLWKSICGDSSDGYVGVRGLGEKAFSELVEAFGYDGLQELERCVADSKFEPLLQAIEESNSKVLRKLYDARDEWTVSYKVAKIHPEWCSISFGDRVIKPQWTKRVPSVERVTKVLEPLGLMAHYDKLKKYLPRSWLLDAKVYATTNMSDIYAAMRDSWFVAFDYESYDSLKHPEYQAAKAGYVDVLNQAVTGASFAFGGNFQYCFYMPTKHRDTANVSVQNLKAVLLAMEHQQMIAHNAMFEQVVTYTNMDKYTFEKPVLDTVIMSSYTDENESAALKKLSKRYLNYDQITYREVVGEGTMLDVSGAEVLAYGCDDSIVCAHLAVLFIAIMETEGTFDFYFNNEPYFDKAMLGSFVRGVPIDYEKLSEFDAKDNELYKNTYVQLRNLLSEHCASTNEDGFLKLWAEVAPFERKKLEEKGKSPEAIETVLTEKKTNLYKDAKYNPIQAPEYRTIKRDISTIAKRLNLPAIRSIKQEWVETYCVGMRDQAEKGANVSADQQVFLGLLEPACALNPDAIDSLQAWMNAYVQGDEALWLGDQLNAGSSDQMAKLFYAKMDLPILLRNISKKGDDKRSMFELEGAPSTNENAIRTWMTTLDKEGWQYNVLDCILVVRGIRTRRSLYYKPYPLWRSPIDGYTHPQIRNCGTVTRRPSGTAYNILQVSKTKDDGHMRSCFLPRSEDELVVSIDFVQEELVFMAGESGDINLRACYVGDNKKDVHTRTGLEIYNAQHRPSIDYAAFEQMLEIGDKTANTIRKVWAKRTNFLVAYGGGAQGMARKIIVPLAMAEDFYEAFFTAYPKVRDYQDRKIKEARTHGYVTDCFGIRRHLPNIFHKNKRIRASAERQAGNAPIQGGAAGVLKIVLHDYVKHGIEERFGSTIYGPIYDELVASVPKKHVFDYVDKMADIMEIELPGLAISLSTSVSIGPNWGAQVEIGTRPTRELVDSTIVEIERKENEEATSGLRE